MQGKLISDEEIVQRLQAHPQIRQRIVRLLLAVDNCAGDLRRADDAQLCLTQELRRLGQEAMQAWAQGQVHVTEEEVRRTGRAHREGKKTLLAHHLWRHQCDRAPIPKYQQKSPPLCPKRRCQSQRLLAVVTARAH